MASFSDVRRAVVLAAVAMVTALLVACADPDASADGPATGSILHPAGELLRSGDPGVTVQQALLSGPDTAGGSTIARLRQFPEARAVGSLDGASDLTLGRIVDVAVGPDSTIALLDVNHGTMRVFSPELRPWLELGGFGDGPGELVHPVAVFEREPDGFGVLDAGRRSIEWFIPRAPETSERWSHEVLQPADACLAGGALVVLGLVLASGEDENDGYRMELVHELAAGGEAIESFSAPYAGMRTPLVAETYGTGHLACEPDGGRLWAAYALLGEVHALQADRRLRWVARLDGFESVRWVEVPGVSIGPDRSAPVLRTEHIAGIELLSPALLMVRVVSRRRSSPESTEWETIQRHYFLDPEDGRSLGGFESSHAVLGGGHGLAILYEESPYPRFAVVPIE